MSAGIADVLAGRSRWCVVEGDCLEVLRSLPDACVVDAVVTDPPYGLAFMGKDWDHGIPGVAFWREALRVAKPGAHLLAFGGTRTEHRLVCAIEDAGWEIRDKVMWLYGSGFPKSHNGPWGGTALKPAWESVTVARKPLIGTVAANVETHGTGALNIDGCRVAPTGENLGGSHVSTKTDGWDRAAHIAAQRERWAEADEKASRLGRWPANVVLDEAAGAMLDAQSGELTAGGFPAHRNVSGYSGGLEQGPTPHGAVRMDGGGASRFFYCAKASRSEREAGLEGMARGSKLWSSGEQSPGTFQAEGTDRTSTNHHPTVKPIALMRWLCRLATPPGGLIVDPFCGSGSTGCAAVAEGFRFVGIERDAEYVAIAERRIAEAAAQGSLFDGEAA